jgi:hypothetical protein
MDQAVTRAAGATPSTTPPTAAARRSWAILLTSANHGVVGPLGSTFPHAGEHHERVVVVEVPAAAGAPSDEVNLVLRTAPEAEASAGTVLTDERINHLYHEHCPNIRGFARAIEREVAAQAGQVAVPEDARAAITQAVARCGHKIDEHSVTLFVDPKQDGNALSQLVDRIIAAAPSAPAVAQRAPEDVARDAARFRWLEERFTGFDFYWMGTPPYEAEEDKGKCVIVFECGQDFEAGRHFQREIDKKIGLAAAPSPAKESK